MCTCVCTLLKFNWTIWISERSELCLLRKNMKQPNDIPLINPESPSPSMAYKTYQAKKSSQ